jgi:hypothetical protein
MNNGLGGWTSQPATLPYVNIQDQKAQNTQGGNFTSGGWRTRVLNTIQSDTAGIAGLVSNQVTLPSGTYRCVASAPAFTVSVHQARLQNITDATTILLGTSEAAAGTQVQSRSVVVGQFILSGTKVIELQHQCNTTNGTNGFGIAANFGIEVYAVVEFWKIA